MEFGAKVNNRQNDGIPFIEHHSFETFNEGVRLKESIIIGTLRSTVMEGSFGNQKQHYKVVAYSGTKLPQRDTAALFPDFDNGSPKSEIRGGVGAGVDAAPLS